MLTADLVLDQQCGSQSHHLMEFFIERMIACGKYQNMLSLSIYCGCGKNSVLPLHSETIYRLEVLYSSNQNQHYAVHPFNFLCYGADSKLSYTTEVATKEVIECVESNRM